MYKIPAWKNGLHTLTRDLTVLVCVLTLDSVCKIWRFFFLRKCPKEERKCNLCEIGQIGIECCSGGSIFINWIIAKFEIHIKNNCMSFGQCIFIHIWEFDITRIQLSSFSLHFKHTNRLAGSFHHKGSYYLAACESNRENIYYSKQFFFKKEKF